MKYFKKISRETSEKPWKSSQAAKCSYCYKTIDKTKDNFTLIANWQIKKKADTLNFCSLRCLTEWTKLDDEQDVDD